MSCPFQFSLSLDVCDVHEAQSPRAGVEYQIGILQHIVTS